MKSETDFLFNRKDTAEVMGVSTQAIGLWNMEQQKKKGATGNRVYYDIREVVQLRLKEAANRSGNAPDIQREKSRLTKLQADKADLEYKKMKGELISTDTVTEHWENLFVAFRSKILAIPTRAAAVALNATSIPDVEEKLEAFLLEALEELSGDGMPDEYKQHRQESAPSTETTSETNSHSVG